MRIRKITTVVDNISENSSNSSKIPFRPRKIRKITSNPPATVDAVQKPENPPKFVKPLTFEGEIDLALQFLRDNDPLLATLIDNHSKPIFDSCKSPFLSLVKSILYQQLAVKAAKSIYNRFLTVLGGEEKVLPAAVLSVTAQELREIGVSYRKASYLHDLSEKFVSGDLSDESILEMNEERLYESLMRVKGIGPWSVHMFMIFSLHKPDVLPVSDLGVRKGVKALYGLKELPDAVKMEEVCEKWRPYRSVGSWYMWRLMEAKSSSSSSANVDAVVVATSIDQSLVP